LVLRDWGDGEAVVYDTLSGSTHVVDELAAYLLRLLADHPDQPGSSLLTALRAEFDVAEVDLERQLDRALLALGGIGLVTRDEP
jgi:PqqD family protein of HPr-rel-A system